MRTILPILVLIAIMLIMHAYANETPCSADDAFKGIDQRFKIVAVEPNGKGVRRTVGGTVTPVDGCKFTVTNFTISPPGKAAYWYGIPKGQDYENLIPRIIPFALGTYNGQTANFALSTVSWKDLDGLAVYSEEDSRMYGKALWVPDKMEESSTPASIRINFGLLAIVMMFKILMQ